MRGRSVVACGFTGAVGTGAAGQGQWRLVMTFSVDFSWSTLIVGVYNE